MAAVIDKKKQVQTAQNYLRGERIPLSVIREVAMTLFDLKLYSYARRVLARLYDENPYDREIQRKWAMATYKDDDQPGISRFAEAAVIISQPYLASNKGESPIGRQAFNHSVAPPQDVDYAEDAAILGSVFKQKWRYDNQQVWLEQSLMYYERGYQLWAIALKQKLQGPKITDEVTKLNLNDNGYSCLNVAYLCDMLASGYFKAVDVNSLHSTGEHELHVDTSADPDSGPVLNIVGIRLQKRAFNLRKEIIKYCEASEAETLTLNSETTEKGREKRYWFYITWAEALLGLDDRTSWSLAEEKVEVALQYADANTWLRDTTTRQNAAWIDSYHFRLEGHEAAARKILERISNSANQSSPGKRLGVALSGGGFRAALFHIGVLARLAEQDLLRKVEVISCVSGGSILGAFYYLKIRNLLQSKHDEEITREDYIQIVREIQREFLEYINYDLRTNLFKNPLDNLRMVFNPDYSRTLRLADLYEKHLYAKLLNKGEDKSAHIYMQDLLIYPKGPNGEPLTINPKRDNWKRRNKVPMLVLNTTALNTGHCWQFTATWMGEPPSYINNEIDALPTLRRMYYEQAPPPHNKIRLATAVAASSCVPGLFHPVVLRNLYRQKNGEFISVELVDGGVNDNQGINTLLEQDCSSIIISDASGQLVSVDNPASGSLAVTGRTNSLLQERIRAVQLNDLEARHNSGLVEGYLLMHLTKGLPSEVIDWHPCDDPYEPNLGTREANGNDRLTYYGIRKNIQTALAKIRTDLDAFHESEAYMLMYSAYRMTDKELSEGIGTGEAFSGGTDPVTQGTDVPKWDFYNIRHQHDNAIESEKLLKLLNYSSRVIKLPYMSWPVQVLLGLALATGLWAVWQWGLSSDTRIYFCQHWLRITLYTLGCTAILAVLWRVFKLLRLNPVLIVIFAILGLAASPLLWLMTGWLNWLYLRSGRVKTAEE